jgi:hypothetical protein
MAETNLNEELQRANDLAELNQRQKRQQAGDAQQGGIRNKIADKVGDKASDIAQKTFGASDSDAAALGGAISTAVKNNKKPVQAGESVGGYYAMNIATTALLDMVTWIGFFSGLIYLNIHYIMSRKNKGKGFFVPLGWRKWILLLADMIVIFIPIIILGSLSYFVYSATCGTTVIKYGAKAVNVVTFGYVQDFCNQSSQFSQGQSGGAGAGSPIGGYTGGPSDAEIRAYLNSLGISVNKPCIDPTVQEPNPPGQTCLTNMNPAAVNEIGSIAAACDTAARGPTDTPDNRCGVLITGGSEPGHETGPCSHSSGNKFDLQPTTALNNYITNPQYFTPNGIRSDGAPLYKDNSNSIIYADERNISGVGAHWDVGGVGCN